MAATDLDADPASARHVLAATPDGLLESGDGAPASFRSPLNRRNRWP